MAFEARPEKALVAAWVATGFFEPEHFPQGRGMDREAAIATLDESGMLRKLGVPPDAITASDLPERVRPSSLMFQNAVLSLECISEQNTVGKMKGFCFIFHSQPESNRLKGRTHKETMSHSYLMLRPFSSCRWYWCAELEGGRLACLPVIIAHEVERQVCQHRRYRKELLVLKPANWESKLSRVDEKQMSFVFNRRMGDLASQSFLRQSTHVQDNRLEFLPGKGKGCEMLRIAFTRDTNDLLKGSYKLSGSNWGPHVLRCVSRKGEDTGWDFLKEVYEGKMRSRMGHEMGPPHPQGRSVIPSTY